MTRGRGLGSSVCSRVWIPRRDVAQPGSAPEWGSGGRRFESCHPDVVGQRLTRPVITHVMAGFSLEALCTAFAPRECVKGALRLAAQNDVGIHQPHARGVALICSCYTSVDGVGPGVPHAPARSPVPTSETTGDEVCRCVRRCTRSSSPRTSSPRADSLSPRAATVACPCRCGDPVWPRAPWPRGLRGQRGYRTDSGVRADGHRGLERGGASRGHRDATYLPGGHPCLRVAKPRAAHRAHADRGHVAHVATGGHGVRVVTRAHRDGPHASRHHSGHAAK